MNILELYKEKNRDKKWYTDHAGSAMQSHGKMFDLFSTNFRDFKTIFSSFTKLKEIVGIEREYWPKTNGQEEHKQYTKLFKNTKLFYEKKIKVDNKEESFYYLTGKGKIFDQIINNKDYSEDEKYFLAFVLISDSVINNEKNHLLEKSKKIFEELISIEKIPEDILVRKIEDFLRQKEKKIEEYMKKDLFFIHSFYDDQDFLIKFLNSSEGEKKELRKYILENKKNKKFSDDCLAQKYKSGGSFNGKTLYAEIYMFYLNILIYKNIDEKKEDIFNFLLEKVSDFKYEDFDVKKISNILSRHKELFFDIYGYLANLDEEDFYNISFVEEEKKEERIIDEKLEYLDETDFAQRKKIKQIFNSLKKPAKMAQDNKCIFDGDINNCQYFTSKSTNETYLEIHHLIPREFRNEFSYSIEVLANYVALCPHCHRKIHNATDREREVLLNSLLNKRQKRLENVGLDIDIKKIKQFYKFG